jgi:hypothetical protein
MPFGFGSKKKPANDQIEITGAEGDLAYDEKTGTAPLQHEQLSDEEAAQRLKLYKIGALNDPNLPTEDIDALDDALGTHDVGRENQLVEDLVENSPYPEVSPDGDP